MAQANEIDARSCLVLGGSILLAWPLQLASFEEASGTELGHWTNYSQLEVGMVNQRSSLLFQEMVVQVSLTLSL